MGVEVKNPALSKRALALNITNEGGIDGTYRLLKNIMGLWLVQQCKRSFDAAGKKYEYAQLAAMAAKAKPLRSIVNLNDPRFLNPPDMPKAIQEFVGKLSNLPKTEGELVRCAYESLALKYRKCSAHSKNHRNRIRHPHRRGRFAEPVVESIHGGRLPTPGRHRPGRSHSDGLPRRSNDGELSRSPRCARCAPGRCNA
jgi:hypothetical protein